MEGCKLKFQRGLSNSTLASTTSLDTSQHKTSPRPQRSEDIDELLHTAFQLNAFRPYQKAVCQTVADGQNVLLVMPTGAGKSLCYQLPGLALGGLTLVISPLIALMEDQVSKLLALGLRADRIHSGRDRMASRRVCMAYLADELDYLFIAPARHNVPGFADFLTRRKPTLIAIAKNTNST